MTSPEVENNEVVVEKVKPKRAIRAHHRYLPDGTYYKGPLSPTYFRDYKRAT